MFFIIAYIDGCLIKTNFDNFWNTKLIKKNIFCLILHIHSLAFKEKLGGGGPQLNKSNNKLIEICLYIQYCSHEYFATSVTVRFSISSLYSVIFQKIKIPVFNGL